MSCSWKWSTSEGNQVVPKSPRPKKNPYYNSQTNAISQSLADDFTKSLADDFTQSFADDFTKSGSREELDSKISERDKIAQRGINPFSQTSYTNDIMAHDLYLKPRNTTMGRLKEPSN